MTALRTWFAGRSLRERRLILVMLALLVVALVFALVIRPVRDGLASSRERYTGAVVRLGEAQSALVAVKNATRRREPALTGTLADAVRTRADAAGFTLASLDPESDTRVRASIATARAGAVMGWVAGLEADGILVDALSVRGNGDGTVTASMTLTARGG